MYTDQEEITLPEVLVAFSIAAGVLVGAGLLLLLLWWLFDRDWRRWE